jgi:predicted Zn finger-like uncharacterized protein
VRFTCRNCGRTYIVAQELAGLAFKMKCKTCGQVIAVRPAAPPPAPVEIPAPPAETAPARGPPAAPAPIVPAAPAAPAEARAPRASRDAERPEVAARPAEPAPPRPRHRRMPNPRLHQPTFVLSAILAVLVAMYFFLNREPGAKPARSPVATPLQVAPSPDASAPPKVAPSPDPAGRPTTAGTRLP